MTDYPTTKDGYEIIATIGRGATANVYAAICKTTKERVAIKCIDLEKYGANIEEIRKEIQVMSQCDHENVVNYHTSFVVKEELWLVMRLLEGGSVLEIMKYYCPKGFEEVLIASILKEVLQGLQYFHKNGQIHRDVKAGNILLDSDGTVQLADFGVSSWLVENGERKGVRQTFVGTPCWMAPEVMEQVNGYDYKADIWSFGITAIELATGHAPFAKYSPMKVLMLTLQNPPPSLDLEGQHSRYTKIFKKMIDSCLQKDPTKRPTAAELLKNEFFKKARGKEYIAQNLLAKLPPVEVRASLKQKEKNASTAPSSSSGDQSHAPRKTESGRYRKNESGEWDFEPFENSDESDSDEDVELPDIEDALNHARFDDNTRHSRTESSGSTSTSSSSSTSANNHASAGDNPTTPTAVAQKNSEESGSTVSAAHAVAFAWETAKVVELKLRLRDKNRQLKDIRFTFTRGEDTAEQIATELVEAGLLEGADSGIVAENINKIIDPTNRKTSVKFPLSEASNRTSVDADLLQGFAQIILC